MITKRILLLVMALAILTGLSGPSVLAAPYDGYNYSYWGDAVPVPVPYLPSQVLSGDALGVGNFNDPHDLFTAEDGHIYVADTGNQRIVILGPDWKVIRTITDFEHDGKKDQFKKPNGIFVKKDGTIYVADFDNKRVVVLTGEGRYLGQIDNPKSEVLPSDFAFFPLKVAVDSADRVYVVAKGVFEGIMQFNSDGSFIGYMGTNTVTPNLYDYFWKMISTKAQRSQMVLFVPTEFTNLDMDQSGFVYATNIDKQTATPIKRLNPSGNDVLKRFGYFPVRGDMRFQVFGTDSGPSLFGDIKAGPDGTYSALDLVRGRIFTYDDEGNLLYIFGGTGTEWGTFKTPMALERTGDRFLVLDAGTGRITVFAPTEFGEYVNQANRLHYIGKEQEAADAWKKVLALNANYDIAYIGIGKAQLRQHDYKEAMRSFKLGMNRQYYAIAFSRYRKQVLREHLGGVMTVLTVLTAIIAAWIIFRRTVRNRRSVSRAA